MAEVKDYVKVILTALLTALVTLTVTGAFQKNAKINNAASKTELTKGIEDAKSYTDKELKEHEGKHTKISNEITEIKESNVRLEGKVDEILFLMINKTK